MYVGHAAVALALKSRDPRVSLVPLALACYGPDWVEVALMVSGARADQISYSHALPAVLGGALVASALYALVARRPGALLVLAGWLLHWPADLLTGRKRLVGLTPLVGLDLYHRPYVDFALETVAIAAGCFLYARAIARTPTQRRTVIVMGITMSALQLAFDGTVATSDSSPGLIPLAQVEWRSHLTASARTALAPLARTFSASESWVRME
jgi:hypothetical protein